MSDVCRLCDEPAVLCDSHIVPEFLFRMIYGNVHRLVGVDERVDFAKTLQIGVRHKLFCKKCESFLNENIEQPFKSIFDTGLWEKSRPLGIVGSSEVRKNEEVDYRGTKLFFISILWRFSLVPSSNFFIAPGLGPHGDHMKIMVKDLEPRSEEVYPVRLYHLTLLGKGADLISGPNYTKDGKFYYYRFLIPNYLVEIQVGSERLMMGQSNSLNLKGDNSLIMFHIDLGEANDFHKLHQKVLAVKPPKWITNSEK